MKTLKMMLAAVLLFAFTQSADAQFRKKENNRVPDRFHMGLRAGITSNTYGGDAKNIDPLVFPTGGFALDFQVAPIPIFVGMGLNYVNYGYSYDIYGDTETDTDPHGIQFPLTASYHINVAPNFFVNPFFGGFVSYAFDSPEGFGDEQVNYGIRLGCGINFGRLTLDIGYDLGLANLGGEYYEYGYGYRKWDINTSTVFMTIGFNWAGSR